MSWRAFWDFIDDRAIIRRFLTIATFAVVVYTLQWSLKFAEQHPADGAATLAAIWGPLNLLAGFMFSSYSQSRKDAA